MLVGDSVEKEMFTMHAAVNGHSGILTPYTIIPRKFQHTLRNVPINNIFMVLPPEFPYQQANEKEHLFAAQSFSLSILILRANVCDSYNSKIQAFDNKHHQKHKTTDVVNYLLHLLMHSCMALKTGMRLHVSNS
uniref:Uncharacterized protein n=1 Tax=Glossina palpalis gambiensis TaxID=67801 RepID=A0A1B0AXS6_9MUSC